MRENQRGALTDGKGEEVMNWNPKCLCGWQFRSGSRFCGKCGTPLARASARRAKRLVFGVIVYVNICACLLMVALNYTWPETVGAVIRGYNGQPDDEAFGLFIMASIALSLISYGLWVLIKRHWHGHTKEARS
jgi:hypothetical protein